MEMEPGLKIGIRRLTTAFLLVLVLIGMPLERKHAVRLLELVVGGSALDIEHGVVAARQCGHLVPRGANWTLQAVQGWALPADARPGVGGGREEKWGWLEGWAL